MALSIGVVAQQYDLSVPTLRIMKNKDYYRLLNAVRLVGVNSGKLI